MKLKLHATLPEPSWDRCTRGHCNIQFLEVHLPRLADPGVFADLSPSGILPTHCSAASTVISQSPHYDEQAMACGMVFPGSSNQCLSQGLAGHVSYFDRVSALPTLPDAPVRILFSLSPLHRCIRPYLRSLCSYPPQPSSGRKCLGGVKGTGPGSPQVAGGTARV